MLMMAVMFGTARGVQHFASHGPVVAVFPGRQGKEGADDVDVQHLWLQGFNGGTKW